MNKKHDTVVEVSAWAITISLLILFIPRNRIREAHISFLSKQIVTWLFGLIVVEKKMIAYPHRLFFKFAHKSSFTFEYFVYPALCALFNLYYPEKSHSVIKLMYYFIHTSLITGFELFAVKYTNLIKYKNWTWYWTFITIWFTYYLSRVYFKWFYKDRCSNNKNFSAINSKG